LKIYKKSKDILESKNNKFFCSVKCSNEWLGTKSRGEKHPNWVSGKSSYRNILKRKSDDIVCLLCHETNKLVLIVHHIDHNRDNNKVTNLAWLCRNCHFLVHHHTNELERFNNKIKYAY
jgi:hypothetical protein